MDSIKSNWEIVKIRDLGKVITGKTPSTKRREFFGSDYPFGDPKEELSKVMDLSIPRENKEMILGHNLRRLLKDSNVAD